MRHLLTLLTLLLAACGGSAIKSPDMDTIDKIPRKLEEQLAFYCAYEQARTPQRDPEAEQLFKHARWLQKKNLLKNEAAKYPAFERLYRIAAAWGHDKAAHNLLLMLMRGQSASELPITEGVDLVQGLVDRGLPLGYYDMGVLLYQGYGVEGSEGLALQYMRHAADLGSADAQAYIGEQLNRLTADYPVPYKIGDAMKRCAAEQGHSESAMDSATALKLQKNYPEALKYYQLAVKAGNETAAQWLSDAFLAPPSTDELDYLALEKDEERSRRYNILSDILGRYSYLHPTVDDIDAIVPLPPAKLPPWDGKIQWLKDWESNVPPPLPGEARIVEMARAKGL
ncbi:SEL1-like repeat protein, partial [Vogesella indigofera]|uniref:SEL1-like repeat protein n=1 Tax=Vogesella indigofera TaxID=45465 RepID=UPI0014733AAE